MRDAYGRSVRRYIWLVIVVITFSLSPSEVLACSCAGLAKPALADRATVVFSGVVTALTKPFNFGLTCTSSSTDPVVAAFEVDLVYKGEAPATTTVRTVVSGASCGYEFVVGKRYTVFATAGSSGLETGLCGGNVEGTIVPSEYDLHAGHPPRT